MMRMVRQKSPDVTIIVLNIMMHKGNGIYSTTYHTISKRNIYSYKTVMVVVTYKMGKTNGTASQ